MKFFSTVALCALAAVFSGCSKSPVPAVAGAYANKFGVVESSRFRPCPKVQGVWQLSKLSAGSLRNEKGETVEHFRWVGPQLFGLTVSSNDYVAVEPHDLETVLYLTGSIPGSAGKRSVSYTAKTDKEMPCLGHGWRQAAVIDHSPNDAAARVLRLAPEKPKKITQTDYFAKDAANELVLGTRIEFQGTNVEAEPVNGAYWHFLKMPRLFESPKEKGFRHDASSWR
jgi:hypothetical protein